MNHAPTPTTVLGGGGLHPSLARHLQQQPQPRPAASALPASPATTPTPTPALGGGGYHPAVAKHLQGR